MKSVIHGRDNDTLKEMMGFYKRPNGATVDLTANVRRMWKGLDASKVTFCDIDPTMNPDVVCDFNHTPFPNNHASLVIFDPPHLPSAAGSPKSLDHFVKDFGLRQTVGGDNIDSIFAPALQEISRILMPEGLLFTKLSDFVHNHNYQWSLVSFIEAVRSTEGLTPCDLIVKIDPSAGNLKSGRWVNSHHARRSCCWWIIVRKGGCEPKK